MATPTLRTIIKDLERWKKTHKPYDRLARLGWFQFTIEAGKQAVLRRMGKRAGMPRRLLLSQHALGQLITSLGYTKSLYRRLSKELNIRKINVLMQHKDYSKKKVRLRIIDRNTVRAVVSDKFRPFDNIKLLSMLVPRLGSVLVSWYFNDEMVLHASLLARRQIPLKPNDPLRRGLHISNSEVGVRSVTITSYVYRKVCENGLIGIKVHRFRHVGTSRRLRRDIILAFDRAQADADKVIDKLRVADEEAIKNPKAFLDKLAKTRRLTLKQVEATRQAMPGGRWRPTDKFELSQALAKAANNKKFDGDPAYKLRQAAVYVLGV